MSFSHAGIWLWESFREVFHSRGALYVDHWQLYFLNFHFDR